jgi:hypothetical protein
LDAEGIGLAQNGMAVTGKYLLIMMQRASSGLLPVLPWVAVLTFFFFSLRTQEGAVPLRAFSHA